MVIVVCSVDTGAPRVSLGVAGHSRTMAYTASALDVYLVTKEKQSYGHWLRYNIGKKSIIQRGTKIEQVPWKNHTEQQTKH